MDESSSYPAKPNKVWCLDMQFTVCFIKRYKPSRSPTWTVVCFNFWISVRFKHTDSDAISAGWSSSCHPCFLALKPRPSPPLSAGKEQSKPRQATLRLLAQPVCLHYSLQSYPYNFVHDANYINAWFQLKVEMSSSMFLLALLLLFSICFDRKACNKDFVIFL